MKTPMQRVRKPKGRIDWLAASLIQESVRQSNDPAIKAAYAVSRGEVEGLLKNVLGPRTSAGRKVKHLIEAGQQLIQQVRRTA